MFCDQCGSKIRDLAKFCQKCGQFVNLTSSAIAAVPVSQVETTVNPFDNLSKGAGKKSVLLVIFLTLITGGIYTGVWYLRQREFFNRLSSNKKISTTECVLIIVFASIGTLLAFASGAVDKNLSEILNGISSLFVFFAAILNWILAFRARSILAEHYLKNFEMKVYLSGLATFFFQIYYLQYEINHLPQTKRNSTFLIILFAFLALPIIAILAAILIPSFIRARAQSQLAACESNLRNLATATEMYANDYKGYYPESIDKLIPKYIRQMPTCPVPGKETYAYLVASRDGSGYPNGYRIYCQGEWHKNLGIAKDLPAFTSAGGLITKEESLTPDNSSTDKNNSWTEFNSVAGQFKVMLPSSPRHETQTLKIPNSSGQIYEDIYTVEESNGNTFMIMTAKYPAQVDVSHPDNNLEGALNGTLTATKGSKLLDSKSGTFMTYHALDSSYKVNGGYVKNRMIMVGHTLYELALVCQDDSFNQQEYDRFRDSFTLMSGSP